MGDGVAPRRRGVRGAGRQVHRGGKPRPARSARVLADLAEAKAEACWHLLPDVQWRELSESYRRARGDG
ncbi:hypothetical protein GCM10010124_41380 [Pilimelia terevasa]|uniref:Uncharacterized protein n=1 Tax=Pilimelia terevasa TaxID=53372 RepID=A0A8J3BVW8_9ACTN|nr:hypothetical protein GCM10010124_41380 [Pilimelia terevasa]